MRKIWKKWPFLLNIAGILILGVLILGLRRQAEKEEGQILNETQSLKKESKIDSFSDAQDAALYVLSALKKNDIDMALRGFAIDETALQMAFVKTARAVPQATLTDLPALTSDYAYYFPLTSAEMTAEYIRQFEQICEELPEIETLEVVDITEKSQGEQEEQLAECLAAQEAEELEILVMSGNTPFLLEFTAVRYDENWKIHSLKPGLLYENNEQAVKLAEGTQEPKKVYKLPDKLAGANYFQTMPVTEKTPERAIEQFIYAIQKGNLTKALAMETVKKSEDTSVDILKKQGENAKDLKKMLYGFLGVRDVHFQDKSEEQMNQLREKLNPGNMVYLDLIKVIPIASSENPEHIREYAGLYSYNGKNYLTGYTLCQQNGGWQILSLGAPALSLEPGEVMYLSKEESRKTSEQNVLTPEGK